MKILSTKAHGALDYLIGAGMIVTPFILRADLTQASSCILLCAGVATLVNSLTTNYEFGLARNISMGNHLKIDAMIAMAAGLLPFLFSSGPDLPNLLFGSVQFVLAMITHKSAFYKMFHSFTYRKFEKFPSYRY